MAQFPFAQPVPQAPPPGVASRPAMPKVPAWKPILQRFIAAGKNIEDAKGYIDRLAPKMSAPDRQSWQQFVADNPAPLEASGPLGKRTQDMNGYTGAPQPLEKPPQTVLDPGGNVPATPPTSVRAVPQEAVKEPPPSHGAIDQILDFMGPVGTLLKQGAKMVGSMAEIPERAIEGAKALDPTKLPSEQQAATDAVVGPTTETAMSMMGAGPAGSAAVGRARLPRARAPIPEGAKFTPGGLAEKWAQQVRELDAKGTDPNDYAYANIMSAGARTIRKNQTARDRVVELIQQNQLRANGLSMAEITALSPEDRMAALGGGGQQPVPAVTLGAGWSRPIKKIGSSIEKIASPATVDADAARAAANVRAETGTAARATETTKARMEEFHKPINALADKLPLIAYIETRTTQPAATLGNPRLQRAADAVRDELGKRKTILENLPSTEQMSFVEDYYPHMWKDPAAAQSFLSKWHGSAAKEGTGKNLKQRSIPTIADGIRAGLEPVTTNPVEATIRYAENMDKYIATNTIFEKGKAAGDIKYAKPGMQPDGWVPIKGRLGVKMTPAGDMVAYAPENYARIYNNYVSRGIHESSPDLGKVYDTLRHGNNAVTQLELGLSAYHGLTMAQESFVNGIARGIDELARGQPVKALKSIFTSPVEPVRQALKGREGQRVYLGKTQGTPQQRQIADIITEAGGRPVGARHAPDYEMSPMNSYWTSFRRGALKGELLADAKTIQGAPVAGTAKVALRHIGRALQTVAQPLFEKYIPMIKHGALQESVASWMTAHPNATHEETVAAARDLVDRMDDRFGEMIQDNVFMDKVVKQAATLALRSWSWTMGGDIRALGGGVSDAIGAPVRAAKKLAGRGGEKPIWTPKMSYVVALPIGYAALSAAYQYLKTGEAPADIQDLLAPRTGGVNPPNYDGVQTPERLLMPGYMKDVFGFFDNPTQEAANKISTGVRVAGETASILGGQGGSDWRGDPIVSPPAPDQSWLSNVPSWLQQYMKYAANQFGPISLRNAYKGQKTGSNISNFEAGLGVRTAPAFLQDPKGHEDLMNYLGKKRWDAKTKYDAKQDTLRAPTPPPESRTKDDVSSTKSGTDIYRYSAKNQKYKFVDERAALWMDLEKLGKHIDHRWSVETLRQKIKEAQQPSYGGTQ